MRKIGQDIQNYPALQWLKALISSLIRIILGVAIGLPLCLYFFQDKLLFIQTVLTQQEYNIIRKKYLQNEVFLTTPDNIKLHGWFVNNTALKKAPLLIYFGGNAEEVSGLIFDFNEHFKNRAFVLINYRGYGLSEGKPSQYNLYQDALFLYDYFAKKTDIDNTKIVVMGRSLGTGVAVYLAAKRPLHSIILVSPYDSVQNVAQEIYPYLPVSLILRHPFNSIALAPDIKTRMLVLIAQNDTLILPAHSEQLIQVWGGRVEKKIFPATDHNNINDAAGYWESILSFLSRP